MYLLFDRHADAVLYTSCSGQMRIKRGCISRSCRLECLSAVCKEFSILSLLSDHIAPSILSNRELVLFSPLNPPSSVLSRHTRSLQTFPTPKIWTIEKDSLLGHPIRMANSIVGDQMPTSRTAGVSLLECSSFVQMVLVRMTILDSNIFS